MSKRLNKVAEEFNRVIVTECNSGYIVRWKHNNRKLKMFLEVCSPKKNKTCKACGAMLWFNRSKRQCKVEAIRYAYELDRAFKTYDLPETK